MSKSTSTALLIILLIFTFPVWIGLAGGIFGLAAGLFGAAIGIAAGIFGAIFGAIGEVFSWVFGGIFNWDFHPAIHVSKPVTILLIILVIALIVKSRKQTVK